MKRRCFRVFVCGLALGLLALAGWWLLGGWQRGPIRYENFERIALGMTEAEVALLLGCAPGDYSTGTVHLKIKLADGTDAWQEERFEDFDVVDADGAARRHLLWFGDRGMIGVMLDREGRVCDKGFERGRRLPPDWWLALERLVGRDSTSVVRRPPALVPPPTPAGAPPAAAPTSAPTPAPGTGAPSGP
jgi:hypothetical protein